jgi:hypothetical protein
MHALSCNEGARQRKPEIRIGSFQWINGWVRLDSISIAMRTVRMDPHMLRQASALGAEGNCRRKR